MLRIIIPTLIALTASAAHAQPPPSQLAQRSAESFLMPCPQGNQECERVRAAFIAAWPAALRGEYRAARNAAFFLTNQRASPPMRMDPVAACALRMVVLASGHTNVDLSDVTNLRSTCLELGPQLTTPPNTGNLVWNMGLSEATRLIDGLQRAREAQNPITPPAGRPLDGTARPLEAPIRPR